MKYLTTEELLKDSRYEAHEILVQCEGKSIRDNFALKIFNKYYQKFFSRKDQKMLDLGPDSGGFIKRITEAGYSNIYGTDLDDYRKEENKKLFKEFKTSDLSREKIPWPDSTFKMITAWCILPHLENPFHAAREIHRVLDKDGVFIMSTPFLTSKPSKDYFLKYNDFGSYRASNNHLILFTKGVFTKGILRYFDLVDTDLEATRGDVDSSIEDSPVINWCFNISFAVILLFGSYSNIFFNKSINNGYSFISISSRGLYHFNMSNFFFENL